MVISYNRCSSMANYVFKAEYPEAVDYLPDHKVYLDLTFLVNFIMDFIILYSTARLCGSRINYRRIAFASIAGAVYAAVSLVWDNRLAYSLPAKLIFSCLMLLIVFYPAKWRDFGKQIIYFYGISFFAAGATMALPNLIKITNTGQQSSILWLAGAAVLVILLGVWGGKYLISRIVPGLLKFDVEMRFDNQRCLGRGFLDTGNSLRDPLTNQPVLVAEYSLLKHCLPEEFQQAIEGGSSENEVIGNLTSSIWAHRLRLIPFQSIGQKNGLLLGIRADEVMVNTGKKSISHYDLVVGIYRDKLSCDDSYRLLIPSAILEKV